MKKFLKPKEGMLIRDPYTKKIMPEEGMEVDWDGSLGRYWRRRFLVGDCIQSEQKIEKTDN